MDRYYGEHLQSIEIAQLEHNKCHALLAFWCCHSRLFIVFSRILCLICLTVKCGNRWYHRYPVPKLRWSTSKCWQNVCVRRTLLCRHQNLLQPCRRRHDPCRRILCNYDELQNVLKMRPEWGEYLDFKICFYRRGFSIVRIVLLPMHWFSYTKGWVRCFHMRSIIRGSTGRVETDYRVMLEMLIQDSPRLCKALVQSCH